MIHLIVTSGLCQRLFPIISAMRYCRDTQQELTIYWKVPVSRVGAKYDSPQIIIKEHLSLFFRIPPNITLKPFLLNTMHELKDIPILLNESKLLTEFMPKNLWGNPIYPDDFLELYHKPLILPKKLSSLPHIKSNISNNMNSNNSTSNEIINNQIIDQSNEIINNQIIDQSNEIINNQIKDEIINNQIIDKI